MCRGTVLKMADGEGLKTWCIKELSKITECSEEIANYILSIDNINDVEEYLSDFLDKENKNHQEFLQKLLKCLKSREIKTHPFRVEKTERGGFKSKQSDRVGLEEEQLRKKSTKFVPLYSSEGQARAAVKLPGRHPCECLGQKHSLVNNCTECGRIVCDQEGSGPCYFCGALVCSREEKEILARNSKKSIKLYDKLMNKSIEENKESKFNSREKAGLEKAIAHKEKLLEYDKSSARRTKVIDDESDYFASDSNHWLSKKDREALKKKEEKLRERRFASRREMKVTLDFAGRRVVDASNSDSMYDVGDDASSLYPGHNESQRLITIESLSGIANPNAGKLALKFYSSVAKKDKVAEVVNSSGNKQNHGMRIQDKEFQEMSDEGVCLSMHQPWASLLVLGIKKVEGRTWYTPHRGRLWIAAGAKRPTEEDIQSVENMYKSLYPKKNLAFPQEYPTGCLLGCVQLVECQSHDEYKEKHPDGESESDYVFVCENPQELIVKFPLKGKHKIWKLEQYIHKAAKKGLRG